MKRKWLLAFLCAAGIVLLLNATVRVRYRGTHNGLFLFRKSPLSFVVSDDIFLGEAHVMVGKLSFGPLKRLFRRRGPRSGEEDYLEYEWNEKSGDGFVSSQFRDGTKLLTCLSRYVDPDGKEVNGVFVGGGLPEREGHLAANKTGMAFYNDRVWGHLWCSSNEAIGSVRRMDAPIHPSSWQFLGSSVLRGSPEALVLRSDHRVVLDGVPVRIDRFALFRAGERYFILVIRLRNEGSVPVRYFYLYGDEPWVGTYGTSIGNVGWVQDRLIYYESSVDPREHSFAGLYDDGNPLLGETRITGLSNFISWGLGVRPDLVYFSNQFGSYADISRKVPLSSAQNRVLNLYWGPRLLHPGQTSFLTLAIGMGEAALPGRVPVKPRTEFSGPDFLLVTHAPCPPPPDGFARTAPFSGVHSGCPSRRFAPGGASAKINDSMRAHQGDLRNA